MAFGRPHVLIITPSAVPGGMEEILFNLATTLPGYGVTSNVVSLRNGPLVQRLATQGIEAEVIDAGRLRDLDKFRRTTRRLATILRTGRFDLVYSNLGKAHLYAAPAAASQRIPAVWCQAGYPDPAHWIDRLVTAVPAAGVIALSRDAAAAQERLKPRRIVHMMHPGIDLTRFRVSQDPSLRLQYGISTEATLVSLVGRLQPWKGHREFLRAAALLARSRPSVHFALVGGAILGWEGDYPAELERLASSLGLSDRVTFTGHTAEVQRWMAASDIVVNASQPEPFGLVVIEAMAAGCAVAAVAGGGPRDIIQHDRNGLLCATREPSELALAIARLCDHPELRRQFGLAGRARVESCFSREAMAERFATIATSTADNGHAAVGKSPPRDSMRKLLRPVKRSDVKQQTSRDMPRRRPDGLENLLMKPYFWNRPSQLLRRARYALVEPADPSVIRLPWGLAIECDPHEMIGSSITRTGVFEIATTEVLTRLADPGELAVDVGANIGYMTSVLAARTGESGRVIAFEPNPRVYPLLSANVERWRDAGVAHTDTLAKAVSEQTGQAELILPEVTDRNQSTASLSDVAKVDRGSGRVTVETVTLDEVISSQNVGVLKLDVEGHEPEALRGARNLLAQRRIRDLVFEDHSAYPSPTTNLLEENGYAIFALVQRPRGVNLLPPSATSSHPSWDAPMRLATLDAVRAGARMRAPGWRCLANGEALSR